MSSSHTGWMPYGPGEPPSSRGGITLAELMQAYCGAHLFWGAEVVGALTRDDGTGPVAAARDASRKLGLLIADGRLRTWARPIGGGAVEPLPPAMWELDDFMHRFQASALDMERWADQHADPTHWIFVDAAEAEAVVNTARIADEAETRRLPDRVRTAAPSNAAAPNEASPTIVRDEVPPAFVATMPSDAPPARARRLLKLVEVLAATKLSRSSIYEKMKAKTFPDSVKMGVRATAWYEDEIDAWIASPR